MMTRKKPLHLVKYDTKKILKKNYIGQATMFYLIKNQKYTLFYCMKYFPIKRHFIFLAR